MMHLEMHFLDRWLGVCEGLFRNYYEEVSEVHRQKYPILFEALHQLLLQASQVVNIPNPVEQSIQSQV